MPYAYPQWKGFERAPEGHLLDQVIDLSGPMGLAYERSVGFRKDFHAHDRPMIVLPRGSCVMRVRTAAGNRTETHTIGGAVAFIVPSGVEHEDESLSSIFDTLALFPSPSLVTAVADDEGMPRAAVARLMGRAQAVRRGPWLEQLAQEYVFARVVSRRGSARTLAFFERQLLVEILASALRRGRTPGRPTLGSGDTVTGRAVRYIEANLFSDLSLAAIARHAFASPSTLLRHFRNDTGKSPYAYVKARRLEEARRVLAAGTHTVGDVALLVGYENFAAFTTAFTRHFGASPSSFMKRARASSS
ncbi:MAG: helix-turn-helix domain-containing protein [Candidatus Rokuibacteriota bacterium]